MILLRHSPATTSETAARHARALLWWLAEDSHLGLPARTAITEAETAAVSAATVWEIGIKQQLGKLTGPVDLLGELRTNQFTALDISPAHADAAARSPPHHHDPFDRILIAQAIAEGLTVVTADRRFGDYGVPRNTC